MKEASGYFKVGRFLLHGAPRAGKTCTMRLILNKRPKKQNSTCLVEDPVKARGICTFRMMGTNRMRLEKLNEKKTIQMIRKAIKESASKKKAARENQPDQSPATIKQQPEKSFQTTTKDSSNDVPVAAVDVPTQSSDQKHDPPQLADSAKPKISDSELLREIASDLDSLDDEITSLFQCHHVNLVDSGGQPQFANLLPLIFQSQSHHHLVVTRLDELFSDKPANCVEIDGVKYVQQESLALTNLQLIERVCQLASGSESHVIIVGTHADIGNEEEPLAKKE